MNEKSNVPKEAKTKEQDCLNCEWWMVGCQSERFTAGSCCEQPRTKPFEYVKLKVYQKLEADKKDLQELLFNAIELIGDLDKVSIRLEKELAAVKQETEKWKHWWNQEAVKIENALKILNEFVTDDLTNNRGNYLDTLAEKLHDEIVQKTNPNLAWAKIVQPIIWNWWEKQEERLREALTETRYACDKCDREFATEKEALEHRLTHKTETPNKRSKRK